MRTPKIPVTVAAGLLVVASGAAAITANLTLLSEEPEESRIGRMEVAAARAELDASDRLEAADIVPAGVSASEAAAAVAAQVGGTLLSIEWTREDGRTLFEIEQLLDDGRLVEVYVDTASGRITAVEPQEPEPGDPPASGPDEGLISPSAAAAAAASAVGGEPIGIELEQEDGGWQYEVTLQQPDGRLVEADVDAASGIVLSVESDEDDRREDDDEDDRREDDDEDDRREDDDAAAGTGEDGDDDHDDDHEDDEDDEDDEEEDDDDHEDGADDEEDDDEDD